MQSDQLLEVLTTDLKIKVEGLLKNLGNTLCLFFSLDHWELEN